MGNRNHTDSIAFTRLADTYANSDFPCGRSSKQDIAGGNPPARCDDLSFASTRLCLVLTLTVSFMGMATGSLLVTNTWVIACCVGNSCCGMGLVPISISQVRVVEPGQDWSSLLVRNPFRNR